MYIYSYPLNERQSLIFSFIYHFTYSITVSIVWITKKILLLLLFYYPPLWVSTAEDDHDDTFVTQNNNNNTKNINNNSTKNITLDQYSPYYLHPAENPSVILIYPSLSENNYQSQSRLTKRALLSKNEIKFINGKFTTPKEDGHMFDVWERCNNIVLTWISASFSPGIVQSTIFVDNIAQLWIDMHNRFAKSDHFRLSNLLQHIHSPRQGVKSVIVFFS